MKELSKMKSGEVSDEELAEAKESLVRTIPALFASNDQTAGAYARVWSEGLPVDYYVTYQDRVQAVTKEAVAKAPRERLHPEEMATVVGGPSSPIPPRDEGPPPRPL